MTPKAALILCGLLATGQLAAAAQSATPETAPPNLAGMWMFEADLNDICRFHGQAYLTRTGTDGNGGYDCELTAEQDCPAADVRYVVEQSCTVSVENDVATVRSTIRNFLAGPPTESYMPDNFKLIIRDRAHLEGILIGSDAYPAEWRRAEGAIS